MHLQLITEPGTRSLAGTSSKLSLAQIYGSVCLIICATWYAAELDTRCTVEGTSVTGQVLPRVKV